MNLSKIEFENKIEGEFDGKYRKLEKQDEVENYPSITEHDELPIITRLKIILTKHCWIEFDSDHITGYEQPALMRYKTNKYSSGMAADDLKEMHLFEGKYYYVRQWLPLSAYSLKNVPLKLSDRLRLCLLKFCWISFRKEQAPIGRMVLLKLNCEKLDEGYVAYPAQLDSTYDGYEVTHWLEVLHSIDRLNLEEK